VLEKGDEESDGDCDNEIVDSGDAPFEKDGVNVLASDAVIVAEIAVVGETSTNAYSLLSSDPT
jgi:hypothetical protein